MGRTTSDAVTPTMRTFAGLGIAAAVLFLGLVVVNQSLTGEPGTPENFTEVLGQSEERGQGSGIEASGPALVDRSDVAGSGTAPSSADRPADSPAVDVGAEGGAGEISPHTAQTEGEAFFTHTPDPRDAVAGSATVVVKGETEVRLTVAGSVHDGVALISASLDNQSNSVISFDDGLRVLVDVTQDGVHWQTLELTDPDVTSLRPGGTAGVTAELALSAYGEYTLTGRADYLAP